MKAEFIESELELFVQRILMHEFYSFGDEYQLLKISPGAEKSFGYDAKIVGLTPFYCQFKTSDYLTSGKRYRSREKFCKTKGWPIRPGYSFRLRPPSDKSLLSKSSAWQHNILHALWKQMPHAVAYVAPTFHTRSALHAFEPRPSHNCCVFNPSVTSKSHIDITDVYINGHRRARTPYFHGLVSIPPHIQVTSLDHSYFYVTHRDVTFHSEASHTEGASSFGEFLKRNVEAGLSNPTRPDARATLVAVAEQTGLPREIATHVLSYGASLLERNTRDPIPFDGLSAIDQQLALAYSLDSFFGISTFALAKIEAGI